MTPAISERSPPIAASREQRILAQVRAEEASHTVRLEESRDAETGGPHADLADRAILEPPADAPHCGEERRERDHRSAVLVVVQHRAVEAPDELGFDLEAFRCGDVLELYRAKGLRDGSHGLDDARGVPGIDEDGHRGETDERREERRLPLHHRQPGKWPDVAEAQHRRPVGHDGYGVRQVGVEVRPCGIVANRETHACDARRVHVAQDLRRRDRQRRLHADLAAAVTVQNAVGLANETRVRQRVDPPVELRAGRLVDLHRDLPERPSLVAAQRLQVLDHELLVGDHGQDARQRPGPLHGLDQQYLGNFHVYDTDPASRPAIVANWSPHCIFTVTKS